MRIGWFLALSLTGCFLDWDRLDPNGFVDGVGASAGSMGGFGGAGGAGVVGGNGGTAGTGGTGGQPVCTARLTVLQHVTSTGDIDPTHVVVGQNGSSAGWGSYEGTVDHRGDTATASTQSSFAALLDEEGGTRGLFTVSGSDRQIVTAVDDMVGATIVVGIHDGDITLGGGTSTAAGSFDVFIATLSGDGNTLRSLGDATSQLGNLEVARAPGGGAVLAGGVASGTVEYGPTTILDASAGPYTLHVAALDGAGIGRWLTVLGGVSLDATELDKVQVAVDAADDVFVAGSFDMALPALSLTPTAGQDAFVAKLDGQTGSVEWAVPITSAGTVWSNGVARVGDAVLVAGTTTSAVSLGGETSTHAGSRDAFIAVLDASDGSVRNLRSIASPGAETGHGLVATGDGEAVFVGLTDGGLDLGCPIAAGSFDNLFVQILRADGTSRNGVAAAGNFGLLEVGARNGHVVVAAEFDGEVIIDDQTITATGTGEDMLMLSLTTP